MTWYDADTIFNTVVSAIMVFLSFFTIVFVEKVFVLFSVKPLDENTPIYESWLVTFAKSLVSALVFFFLMGVCLALLLRDSTLW